MARVLGALRLSRASDESTSVVRQKVAIQRWADSRGHTIAGWVEDVDVSGAVAPWERPGLGQWLPSTIGKEVSAVEQRLAWELARVDEWDILCGMKLDRISRRVLHIAQLVEWAGTHDKEIAAAEDGFDLSSPMGKILFQLIAAFAEGELEAIKFRAKSSYVHLMKSGRWRGGFVPYGYRAEKDAEGDGWKLVPDEYGTATAEVVREIVRRIVEEGHAINAVCRWLNEEKVPSSLDAQRIRAGKEPKAALWRVGNLTKMLRSHTLLGRVEMTEEITLSDGTKEKRTRLVRDAEGLPLQRAEPLLSKKEWDQLQAKLTENSRPNAGHRHDRSPLLRVAFCVCGRPLYRNNGRTAMYYRCSSRNISGAECGQSEAIRAKQLEEAIEETFLRAVGHAQIIRRTFRPGVDHTQDVAEVTRALAELREDREAGLYSSELGKKEYREEYLRLEAKREALAAAPVVPDRWEEIPTGQTYAHRWAELASPAEKNKELREAGVKAIVHTEELPYALPLAEIGETEGTVRHTLGRVELLLPRDLYDRVSGFTAEHVA
ncbi:recombinase family protein [Streptomyces antarcticus]|uniref:recombinase family protein n=1 Tax=Streptomyces antarcticus TaxID=2996458 RepID=UPI0022704A87|nr:recombinase family protein [Streptomyces sp. H34-AA3]MCY0941303.1 recombinase family protein [Streptomyces sp. H34-AA3]